MCVICGRSSCATWMHSIAEQDAYAPAIEAYDKYVEVRDRCREAWKGQEDEDIAPACDECGSTDCNGECMGDGLMGG